MSVCPVCTAELNPQGTACPQCHTPNEVLAEMIHAAKRPRFLFGRVSSDSLVPDQTPDPRPTRKTPAKTAEGPLFQEPVQPVRFDQAEPSISSLDLDEPTEATIPAGERTLAYVLDLLLCLGLNFGVLQIILWASIRDLDALISYSLIPLAFVFLSLTALYFWLFLHFTGRSLGQTLIHKQRIAQADQEPTT